MGDGHNWLSTKCVRSACYYHTVAELYSSLFALTSWPCQLSFCLCFYCTFFLAFFLYVVPISKQLGVTIFLNQNFFYVLCYYLVEWLVMSE